MLYRKTKKVNGKKVTFPHWHYRFVKDGETIHKNTEQANRATAKEMEAAHRTALARGAAEFMPTKIPTLEEFSKTITLTSKKGKARTTGFYTDRMNSLLRYEPLKNARLNNINADLIKKYVLSRRRKDPLVREAGKDSPATINRTLATLKKTLRIAADPEEGARLIQRVPKIKMEPDEKRRKFVLTREDQQAYLAGCLDPLRDVAALILETGLRLGEALALTWDDVTNGRLEVRAGKSRNAKRSIKLTPSAAEIIRRRKATLTSKWVFPNEAGNGPGITSSLSHQHTKVRTKLNLDKEFVIHSLRHSALTRFAESKKFDVFELMKVAGHATLATTQRYIHPSDEATDDAMTEYGASDTSVTPIPKKAISPLAGVAQ